MYDFLIVGGGLFGGTFARLATDAGYSCLVLEKRDCLGGNLHCKNIEGIEVHEYGPHIFHTNNDDVWQFVNRFAEFNRYTNTPIASIDGEIYNLPFNMNTFSKLFNVSTPEDAKAIIDSEITVEKERIGGIPRNLEEQALCLVGRTIYEKLIKGYTEKQWGRKCSELPAEIIKRLPVRFTYDNNYFNAKYQGIPIGGGYNKFIENLFYGIDRICYTDFNRDKSKFLDLAKIVVYTGRIDEFFGFMYGKLDYRSVMWENLIVDKPNYQGVAVKNYTGNDVPYTRVIEHKFFDYPVRLDNEKTVISYEYSNETSCQEPFYPINDEKNVELYNKYAEEAKLYENVFFGGRLGEYKYYDMDKTIESAMSLFNKITMAGF